MTTSAQRFVAKLAFQAMLALACVLGSQSAMAMRCVASGGADKFVEPIGSVQTYPVNAPDGYIIWISPTRTTTGYCYKDLRAGVSWEDPVFFYANPANMDPAAWGLEIGIRYKGVDHFGASNQVGTGVPTGDIVPVCTTADFDAGLCPKVPVSITYQVVVRKRGTWTGVPQDTYPVFQFDGARGLNCCNTSFQYILSGLENLETDAVHCRCHGHTGARHRRLRTGSSHTDRLFAHGSDPAVQPRADQAAVHNLGQDQWLFPDIEPAARWARAAIG